jgi:RNA polymerase sporulation-specific sigma factor
MFSFFLSLFEQIFFVSFIKTPTFKKPLSKEEEEKYLNLYFKGDKKARDILIEHNLRLVAHIAKKYENDKDLQEDLISIGTIGLIKGIDSYKQDKATKLGTYIAKCIENEILMHLRSNKKRNLDISLNEVLKEDKDGSEITLLEIIPGDNKDMVEDIMTRDRLNVLETHLNVLNSREKEIIIQRYGLYNTKEKTQKEIANELNISRSYVSRIEKRALIKLLKEYLKEE